MINLKKILPSAGAMNVMSQSLASATSSKKYHSSRLKGKVAVVTASTDGIGFAIAKRLGDEGASVVISSRKEENVKKATESLRKDGIAVEGVVCHVGNKDQRKLLFDTAKTKFGGLDILVSNAAVNPAVSPILETDEKVWDKIFEINVKCSWLLAKEAYPELVKRGGGNIVFISSIAGYQPMEPLGTYSVSKTVLLGLTKTIASEIVHDNIRVNCVAPGIVATKFASAITSSEAGAERSLSIVPMKRFGKPEEIAGAVAFLVSDDASYVTGETIVVAGGAYAHL
ncbi:dehydrogenase/reductase SDR family member 4 [Epargyreus clarus]|uniref:dehydrogenase/reductase SDR family member 4 n=1 Tax=Epargyreus clarus TaxID=520877 RepID=UPI003C2CACE9